MRSGRSAAPRVQLALWWSVAPPAAAGGAGPTTTTAIIAPVGACFFWHPSLCY